MEDETTGHVPTIGNKTKKENFVLQRIFKYQYFQKHSTSKRVHSFTLYRNYRPNMENPKWNSHYDPRVESYNYSSSHIN